MSLPPAFRTAEKYFKNALKFFHEYQHLYNFPNTDILVNNILDQIGIGNMVTEEIFDKDFELRSKAQSNGILKEFFETLQELEVQYEDVDETNDDEDKIVGPLGPKKKQEIIKLAKEVKDVCARSGCDTVVDFGSGLGYLDQQIFKTTNLKVLGIESEEYNYICAKKRQCKYYMDSVDSVKYMNHKITENSDENIKENLKDQFEKSTFCITGLHTCADLSIEGIALYLKMADAKALILLPCCYHRMALKDERFTNFPLSKCLKVIYEEFKGYEFLKVPFLRLAAQPLIKESDNIEDLVFNLLARATLQVYAHKLNCKLKRKKRKAVRTKTVQSFEEYLQYAVKGFSLIKQTQLHDAKYTSTEPTFDIEQLNSIWRLTENLKLKAAIFVLLQNYLQPVIENFVLYDRVLYLQEKGMEHTFVKKIFNKTLSPRCLALISIK